MPAFRLVRRSFSFESKERQKVLDGTSWQSLLVSIAPVKRLVVTRESLRNRATIDKTKSSKEIRNGETHSKRGLGRYA